jgi:hypothetical protein
MVSAARLPVAPSSEHVDSPKSGEPRASKARSIERRRVYLGEGLTLRLRTHGSAEEATGEIIDLTPEGMGIAVLHGGADLREGIEVIVEHTGRATAGVTQKALVKNISSGIFGGRVALRVGVAIVPERTTARSAHDRRRAERFECSDDFPALAAAQSPIFFSESLHFRIRDIGAGGMTASTSLRNKGLLPGMELGFRVNFNMIGIFEVRGRVTAIHREHTHHAGFRVGVAWIEPPRALLSAIAEYLLIDDKSLSPTQLREAGLPTSNIERAVTYDYAHLPEDYEEILALRLRARQHEEGYAELTTVDMTSPFDKFGRHMVCRFGGRIIISARITYVGGDPSKSEYVSKGGHEIPEWLWKAGFVECGAGQTEPEFQRSGLYMSFAQHIVRVAMQSGYRYVVFGCADDLVGMFKNVGAVLFDSRMVEPRPGWKFRSHLMYLDMDGLLSAAPEGKFVDKMVSVASFVDGMRRSS